MCSELYKLHQGRYLRVDFSEVFCHCTKSPFIIRVAFISEYTVFIF